MHGSATISSFHFVSIINVAQEILEVLKPLLLLNQR